MSGQIDSQSETTKDRLKKFEDVLQEYTTKLGVGNIPYYPKEVEDCMALTYDEILRLTEDDCGAKSLILNRFAAYIEKEFNRQNVRIKWAEKNLADIVAKEGNKYGDKFTKYELKIAMIANENNQAKTLRDIVLYAEARMLELSGIAKHITLIAKSLNDIRQSKHKYYTDRGE